MKRLSNTLLFTLLALVTSTARQLTPSEALGRLMTVSASKGISGVASDAPYKLVYSSHKNNLATYYAFDRTEGGFVVLSADDSMPPLLMVSDGTASFDIDDIPENMRWWLSQYDNSVCENVSREKMTTTALTSYAEVLPLLGKTQWSQLPPYNNLCPVCNDSIAVTGCVATAMSQIMRYHRWPEKGTGSITYGYSFSLMKDDIEYVDMISGTDFDKHTYQWDDMLDTYPSATSGTESQRQAVAQLMYDCGVAALSSYGNAETGAYSCDALCGMVDHFSYDTSASYLPRTMFTDAEWEERIYKELASGRPVMYSGSDSVMGGHEFVCDGYRDGLFHMNWGWNGNRNCYVALSGMKADHIPAVSAEMDDGTVYASFKNSQVACVNIMPFAQGGKPELSMICDTVYTTCKKDAGEWTFTPAKSFNRESDELYISGLFYNSTYRKSVYSIGIKAEGTNGTYFLDAGTDTLEATQGVPMYGVKLIDILKTGTYTITPVYKDVSAGDSLWHEMTLRSDVTRPKITVRGAAPFLCITDKPVISSNGMTTTSNEVVKADGVVDLNVSVPVTVLNTMIYNRNKHSVSAEIYDVETESYVGKETILLNDTLMSGTATTLTFRNDDNAENINDGLEVGKSYLIEFVHNYESAIAGGPQQVYIPMAKYQGIVFSVVDDSRTHIEGIQTTDTPSSQQSVAYKVLSGGRLLIVKNGKRYYPDGRQEKRSLSEERAQF